MSTKFDYKETVERTAMPGRYGNRAGGHGGRGRGRGRATTTKSSFIKKTVEDYFFYVGSSKQASDYEITAEFVVNHVKKTFDRGNDIAEALRTLTKADTTLWKPTLMTSTDTDTDVKDREDKQFVMEYKAELDQSMRRKRTYEDNTYKAYALLWERCNKAMQNKLASRSDYDSAVYNDPIALLQAIKEHSLNYQETRYEMSIISDAFRASFNTRQKEGESLQDYTRRFKTSQEILESHLGGPLILAKYVQTMDKYDRNDYTRAEAMIKQASEGMFAFLYLENSDQDKYGSIMKNLNSQKSLGNDQYPRTIVETNNVLSNHKLDANKERKPDNKHRPKANANKNKEDKQDKESTPLLIGKMEGKCYCCGKLRHKSPNCRSKEKIPRDEWAINKAQQHMQSSNNNAKSTSGSTVSSKKEETVVRWAGLHCSFVQTLNMKKLILLDSDSTDTVFCNPNYVSNIRDLEDPLSISTNGGVKKSHQKCDIPHMKDVWYNENLMNNIISMKDMTDKF